MARRPAQLFCCPRAFSASAPKAWSHTGRAGGLTEGCLVQEKAQQETLPRGLLVAFLITEAVHIHCKKHP